MRKFLILSLIIKLTSSAVYNYCNQDYCSLTGFRHITCGSSGDLAPSCSWDANVVGLTKRDQQKIVDLHNKYRNKIANGDEEGFNAAARMTSVKWNDDLADYAGLNVRRCKFQHDCHNTPEMKFSGQNLFFQAKTDIYEHNIASFIETAIDSWWNEKEDATQENIDNCCGEANKIPHFLMMVHEKANRIGCALSQYQGPRGKTTYFVCNYSFTIVEEQRIYESGEVGSKCVSGINEKFKGLCSDEEEIDWNKVE